MSSESQIPWNSIPKNGMTSFFTEETFNKWLSQDTHDCRLDERLAKLGIKPPPRLTGPILFSKQKSTLENKDRKTIIKETEPCHINKKGSVPITASFSDDHHTSIRPEVKIKTELHTSNIAQTEFSTRQSHTSSYTQDISSEAIKLPISNSTKSVNDHIQYSGKGITNEKEQHEHMNDIDNGREETVEKTKEKHDGTVLEHSAEECDISMDLVTENAKPFSFYKEGREEDYKVDETDEDDNATEAIIGNDLETANNRLLTNVATLEETDDTAESELTEEQLKELEAQKAKEERTAQTDLMKKDKMFFNIKDRQATKYFPEIFKRKPKNRRSQLTCQEQKLYNDLVRCYGNLGDNSTDRSLDENFKKFIALKVSVNREQELFQKYLKSISFTCKNDYSYVHPEVEKYAKARFLVKKLECFRCPRFYSKVDKFVLTDDVPNPSPTLQYVRPLAELGSVCKLVLPNIVPGMPQPCVTSNFNKINSICPIVQDVYKGTSVPVWNKVVCSKDANAEQLAVPNKCDVVMSSSSIRHLINNQGKTLKYWDMPFTVREYKIEEGEKTTIHKVVYIDKPFIRQSQYIPKDHIQLYQKHAIRACAIRTNVRGHVFCGIKPVHELVKSQTLEEVGKQINKYEETIKETVKKDDNAIDGDDEAGPADTMKRKRKRGPGGMFDVEKDIDDLETFGMDTVMSERSKVTTGGNSPQGKIKMSAEKVEVGSSHAKKSRKSAEEDLEVLKNELKDIKTQAIKESAKHLELYSDSHCLTDKIETQKSEMQNNEKDSEDKDKSDERTVAQNDVPKCEKDELRPEDCDKVTVMEDDIMEKELDTADETVSDNTGNRLRYTRKSKKDLLSVKNISSFSERLKQMSTIKSKLMHRNQGVDSAGFLLMDKIRGNSESTEPMETVPDISTNSPLTKPDSIDEESKTALQKMPENAADSDSEIEGLIIDVPSESPQKPIKNDKTTFPEMPVLERISDNPMVEENPSVSSESEFGSPHLIIAVDDTEDEGKPKLKKRKNTGNIIGDVPKRILRSSLSQESSDTTQTGNQTSECRKNEARRESTSEVTNAGPSPNKRGKKAENQSVSTRSRLVSSGSLSLTSPDYNSRRVTRRSTSIVADAKDEEDVAQSVPLKKGRGRPRKKVEVTKKTAMKEEKSNEPKDASEKTLDTIENKYNKSDNCTVKDEQDITEKVDDSDSEDGVSPIRNKAKVRKIDSEDECTSNSQDEFENIDHGKLPLSSIKADSKKELSGLEARKIKETAAVKKMKISETKSKVDKSNKIVKDDGVVNDNHMKVDKKSNNIPDTADVEEENHMVQDGGKSTVIDELNKILKVPDNINGTEEFKGSAVDVFKQKHGMSSCEFPVQGNVTYHQWNLSGTNIIIRCKYHGFISGQGLVHISPKIEYQPNFGFEQDNVSEICKNWISIYVRPNSTLLRPRINPFNSEIMMFENIAFKDLIPPDSLFKPEQALTDLQVILEKLKSLPVGQYLLKNNPREDEFTILKSTDQEPRGTFDLHLNNSGILKSSSLSPMQWTPINPNLMLPHQRKMNLIPCTFLPKDAKVGNKKAKPHKLKKKKGKKDKGKNKS